MPEGTITPLRPRAPSGYSDTAALNDIHALLTSTDLGADTLADIAAIVARTSRALIPVRDIETSTTETVLGWPVACVDAGETTVFVRQSTTGPGLVIEVCTRTDTELAALAITLDGHPLHPGQPSVLPTA
jgi:hypothetical protein